MARKSLLEKIEDEKFKTVSARVPLQLSNEFDKLVARAKTHGFTISITKVITEALKDSIKYHNLELTKLDKKKTGVIHETSL